MVKWVDNSPLSFKLFLHKHESIIAEDCLPAGFIVGKMVHIIPGTVKITEQIILRNTQTFCRANSSAPCAVMVTLNLADPFVVFVQCQDKILHHVLCLAKGASQLKNHNAKKQGGLCKSHEFLRREQCYTFHWTLSRNFKSSGSKPTFFITDVANFFAEFPFLAYSKSNAISPLFLQESMNKFHLFDYNKHLESFHSNDSPEENSGAFELQISPPQILLYDSLVLTCSDGTLVSISSVCNGILNCPNDDSDELNCMCKTSRNQGGFDLCKTLISSEGNKTCGPLYFRSGNGTCVMILPLPTSKTVELLRKTTEHNTLDCENGKSGTRSICGLSSNKSHMERTRPFCANKNQLPCSDSHSVCFEPHYICKYKLDKNTQLFPCQSAAHIENCKSFECNIMLKCPNAYCIPWEYVCDGKWDCPGGAEEAENCKARERCYGFYQCSGARSSCIHVGNLCDGEINCPLQDDEHFCAIKNVICPKNCHCLGLGLICLNLKYLLFLDGHMFQVVSIQNSFLSTVSDLQSFTSAKVLNLFYTNLTQICFKYQTFELSSLNIKYNSIAELQDSCFKGLIKLQTLVLPENKLKLLGKYALKGLPELILVNLSCNQINHFEKYLLLESKNRIKLSILNNPLNELYPETFQEILLEEIETHDHRVCCVVDESVLCSAERLWPLSCTKLLSSNALKTTFLSVSIAIWTINLCSVVSHFVSRRRVNTGFTMTVVANNVGHMLYAVYLSIVVAADFMFGRLIIYMQHTWRSSGFCLVAYSSVVNFSISVPVLSFFLSLSRLMVVWFPMETRFKTTTFVFRSLGLIFLAVLCFSGIAASVESHFSDAVPNDLCLPFVDHVGHYWTAVFLIIFAFLTQTSMSLAICVMHYALFKNLVESQQNVAKYSSSAGAEHNFQIKLQLTTISLSCTVCWLSSNIIFIAALALEKYPLDMIAWAAAVMVPVNSILNPFVFLFTSVRKIIKN